jgi:hypothetical protein
MGQSGQDAEQEREPTPEEQRAYQEQERAEHPERYDEPGLEHDAVGQAIAGGVVGATVGLATGLASGVVEAITTEVVAEVAIEVAQVPDDHGGREPGPSDSGDGDDSGDGAASSGAATDSQPAAGFDFEQNPGGPPVVDMAADANTPAPVDGDAAGDGSFTIDDESYFDD